MEAPDFVGTSSQNFSRLEASDFVLRIEALFCRAPPFRFKERAARIDSIEVSPEPTCTIKESERVDRPGLSTLDASNCEDVLLQAGIRSPETLLLGRLQGPDITPVEAAHANVDDFAVAASGSGGAVCSGIFP